MPQIRLHKDIAKLAVKNAAVNKRSLASEVNIALAVYYTSGKTLRQVFAK